MTARQHNLDQVRRRLIARRDELAARRSRVERDLARQAEPLVADSSDQAIQLQNDEPLRAIGEAAGAEITAIDAALERLALGLYGTCQQCGEEIQEARLQAVPHATSCTECTRP